MRYTVIGIYLHDSPLVAGVIRGEHPCCDSGGPVEGDGQRWATSVEARSWRQAEKLAITEINQANKEDI